MEHPIILSSKCCGSADTLTVPITGKAWCLTNVQITGFLPWCDAWCMTQVTISWSVTMMNAEVIHWFLPSPVVRIHLWRNISICNCDHDHITQNQCRHFHLGGTVRMLYGSLCPPDGRPAIKGRRTAQPIPEQRSKIGNKTSVWQI